MLNGSTSKNVAIICLTVIAVVNCFMKGVDTVTVAVIGFIGGILVAKA